MSNFLAVDTSSRYLTVIAQKGDKIQKSFIENCALNHSVVLMDEIERTLSRAQLTPAECDFFAAVTGPGSFTGIRIGISCIKGFATALNKRAVGVTSLEMLSYNVNSDCPYLVAIDAAHGNFYACGYNLKGECDIPPQFLSREQVEVFCRPVYGFEDMGLQNYVRLSVEDCLLPAVKAICERQGRSGGLEALYIKKSQAEEERAARLAKNE